MVDGSPIPGFENYLIDKTGNVFSLLRNKYLKPALSGGTHKYVILSHEGKGYKKYIHRVVIETFIGPCPEGMECCHSDGNPLNNSLENLRWGSRTSNVLDAVSHGTHQMSSKVNCKRGHLLEGKNLTTKSSGRECRSCSQAAKYLYSQKTKGKISSYSELQIFELAQIYYKKYLS